MEFPKSPFKWRHFEPAIIPLCVRRYCSRACSSRAAKQPLNSPPTRCISGARPERAHVKLIYYSARPTDSVSAAAFSAAGAHALYEARK